MIDINLLNRLINCYSNDGGHIYALETGEKLSELGLVWKHKFRDYYELTDDGKILCETILAQANLFCLLLKRRDQ